jgi:hypothetical protein
MTNLPNLNPSEAIKIFRLGDLKSLNRRGRAGRITADSRSIFLFYDRQTSFARLGNRSGTGGDRYIIVPTPHERGFDTAKRPFNLNCATAAKMPVQTAKRRQKTGDDYSTPVFEPEARMLLSRVEPIARHYEVRASTI